MINGPIFEWTSRYGSFLDNEIAPLLQHGPLGFYASSFVQYQSLKELLLDIEPVNCILDTEPATSTSIMVGDCCICLEPFSQGEDLVVTKCQHCFHSSCLLKLLNYAERHNTAPVSCPLCRAPSICLDSRRDRAIVDFASAIEASLRATECCQLSLMRHAQLRLSMLVDDASALPALCRLIGGARLRAVCREAAALRDLLRAAALLVAAGREGFRALLHELDARRVGAGPAAVAAARRARSAARRFGADAAPGGAIEAAIADIAALGLHLVPPTALPALPALPGRASPACPPLLSLPAPGRPGPPLPAPARPCPPLPALPAPPPITRPPSAPPVHRTEPAHGADPAGGVEGRTGGRVR